MCHLRHKSLGERPDHKRVEFLGVAQCLGSSLRGSLLDLSGLEVVRDPHLQLPSVSEPAGRVTHVHILLHASNPGWWFGKEWAGC